MYICIYIYVYIVHTYVYSCLCTCVYKQAIIYIYIYIHTHILYTYICIIYKYIYTYTYIHITLPPSERGVDATQGATTDGDGLAGVATRVRTLYPIVYNIIVIPQDAVVYLCMYSSCRRRHLVDPVPGLLQVVQVFELPAPANRTTMYDITRCYGNSRHSITP